MNERVERNYPLRKPLLIKWSFVFYTILVLFFSFISHPVHAGFFSNLFSSASADDENIQSSLVSGEELSSPLAFPLLGSKNIPPPDKEEIKNIRDASALPLATTGDSALIGSRNPLGTLPANNEDQIVVYTVQAGDTLTSIALRFGISLNTLIWANDVRNPKAVKTGDTLVILPVTGVKYKVRRGDTIETIAREFKGDVSEILQFNGLPVGEALEVGSVVIIPDGEFSGSPVTGSPKEKTVPKRQSLRFVGLPQFKGYFVRPITGGKKTQGIHGYNGVDLANSCGLPVVASAEGTIIVARASGWNGGYGSYIVITHPNGVQTLYAHLSSLFVGLGASVNQGDQVGLIGSTGNSTGCHVHFEIRGARNPF